MRPSRRPNRKNFSQALRLLGVSVVGVLLLGLGAVRTDAMAATTPASQANDNEMPGTRGAKVPTDLTQIGTPEQDLQSQPAPGTAGARPVAPKVACCTPGKDCPCTPGFNCPCTPGVNCACTPGVNCACTPGVNCPAKAPQRSEFCKGPNCPCVGANCNKCTPGVNCACTPFINCPEDKGLLFDKDSAEISAENKAKLARVVEELKRQPLLPPSEPGATEHNKLHSIRIEGHTAGDELGKAPPAQVRLSINRAAAVKKVLLDAGLPPEYIVSALGYGGNCKLLLTADDPNNRRVQFVYAADTTLCSIDEVKLRPPVVPPTPPKKGAAKGPANKGPVNKGPARPGTVGAKK